MIVNLTETGWEVIYHRAHALLAAQLAGYWQTSDSTARLVETVAAISHHDDLEREWEGDHLTEAGAPLDFKLDGSLSVSELQEHINNALYRGRWVAMLTSMHLCFLNQGRRGQSSELDQFLEDQHRFQKEWRKSLGLTKTDAEKAYAFMRWCDRLSLILCQRNLPAAERALEITAGPDGERYDVLLRSDDTVTVKPWPFKLKQFSVQVDAAYLSEIKFEENQALIQALQQAPMKTVSWTFVQ